MSVDLTNATKRTRVLGSISGWDRITTDEAEDNTHIPSNDHEYTLPDLYLQLRDLINKLDPEKIEYLIKLISEHINDKDNPHKTTLDKMGTSVIKELYKLWLEKGYIGSEEIFIKQLFQYVKIADLDTTREGQAIDQIPSVFSAATLIKDHNESIDVHENLLAAMFPGTDLQGPPTYSIIGNIGRIPLTDAIVERSGIQYVVNSFGVLEKVEENELKPDWSYGEPGYPIFAAYSNQIKYSEDLSNSIYSSFFGTLEVADFVNSPISLDKNVYFFKEDTSIDSFHRVSVHGDFEQDHVYTFSCYVYPVNRAACGLNLNNEISDDLYNHIGFDFISESVHINEHANKERISGGINKLPSGWYRVWITFKPTKDINSTIDICPLDIYDGDLTYDGNGESGICIFGVQLSETPTVAPYLPTNGKIASCGNTNLSIKTSDKWFNPTQSTIVVSVSNIPAVANTTGNQQYVYKVSGLDNDKVTKVTMLGRYYTGAEQKPYFVIYNDRQQTKTVLGETNTLYKSIFVQSYSNIDKTACFGYLNGEPSEQTLQYPINEIIDTIYLGSDSNVNHYLNGYLFEFIYYPFKANTEQIKFFFGD